MPDSLNASRCSKDRFSILFLTQCRQVSDKATEQTYVLLTGDHYRIGQK